MIIFIFRIPGSYCTRNGETIWLMPGYGIRLFDGMVKQQEKKAHSDRLSRYNEVDVERIMNRCELICEYVAV